MKRPKILKQYERQRVLIRFDGHPSLAHQSFRDECDINNIMKKFERTGLLDHVNEHEGNYGDFTDLPASYHEAQNQVIRAQEMFLSVPSKIRARFNNDPGEFLAYVEDPANVEGMRELGLLPSERAAEQPPARRKQPSEASEGSKAPTPAEAT